MTPRARAQIGSGGGRRKPAFTYVELLVAVLLVAIAVTTTLASVRLMAKVPRNKRVTEMAVYVSVAALERIKAIRYLNMSDVTPLPPSSTAAVWYYDKFGTPQTSATTDGYTVEYGIQLDDSNADGKLNTEDMRHIVVEVRDNAKATLYERIEVYLSFGGL